MIPKEEWEVLEGQMSVRYDFTMDQAIIGCPIHEALKLLSVCVLVMRNGFTIIGKSSPASAANFDAELGRKMAYKDAIRQLWPLEEYVLRDQLADGARRDRPAPEHSGRCRGGFIGDKRAWWGYLEDDQS